MKAELLFFEGCPHTAPARARLQEVLSRLAPGARVDEVRVATVADAERTGFAGSPSVRIDGRDLEDRAPIGRLACRVYGAEGAPPVWLLEAAVLRALQPRHVLFMCVANSARSQLAEAIGRSLAPAGVRVSSAGSVPTRPRPEALEALREIGLDASFQTSKTAAEVESADTVDAVITLCAEEVCPTWLGEATRLHWGLPDPAAVEAPEARPEAFRSVRDELHRRLSVLFAEDPDR